MGSTSRSGQMNEEPDEKKKRLMREKQRRHRARKLNDRLHSQWGAQLLGQVTSAGGSADGDMRVPDEGDIVEPAAVLGDERNGNDGEGLSEDEGVGDIWDDYNFDGEEIVIEEGDGPAAGAVCEAVCPGTGGAPGADGAAPGDGYDSGGEFDVVFDEEQEPYMMRTLNSEQLSRLKIALGKWYLEHQGEPLSLAKMSELCVVLKRNVDKHFPADGRTLEPKIDRDAVTKKKIFKYEDQGKDMPPKEVEIGEYTHIGLEKSLKHTLRGFKPSEIDKRELKIWLYFDGAARFRVGRKSNQFWPIVVRLPFIKEVERRRLVVGSYYGVDKPKTKQVFKEVIDELKKLYRTGFKLEGYEGENDKSVRVELVAIIADAPARAELKGIVHHNALHACEKCYQTAESVNHTSIYDTGLDPAPLRKDREFRLMEDTEHHHDSCAFERLTKVDLIKLFLLDPMHLVYIGVVKRWLEFFIHSNAKQTPIKVEPRIVRQISAQHQEFSKHSPVEFKRAPNNFDASWKAREYRTFALYTGPALLVGRDDIDSLFASNFLELSCALRLLSDPVRCKDADYRKTAKELIDSFVRQTVRIFGENFVVYCVHTLTHLTAEVDRLEMPLDKFSAFFSESFFVPLLKKVKTGTNALPQLIQYIQKVTAADDFFKLGDAKEQYEKERVKGVKLFHKTRNDAGDGYHYLGCSSEKFTLNAKRNADRFCEVRIDGEVKIVMVERFFSVDGADGKKKCFVDGRCARVSKDEFFRAPMLASKLGIFLITSIDPRLHKFPLKDIIRKGCKFPTYERPNRANRDVFIPLLHDKTIF